MIFFAIILISAYFDAALLSGVPQEVLSNVFQSVAASVQQQQRSDGQNPPQSGRIVVEGPPGGPV